MPPENPLRQKRDGIGQPVGPPDLRCPGATHVDYPTVLVAHGDAEVRGEQILFQRPGTKVLLMSGEIESPAESIPFLRKPFGPAVLVERIRQLLDSAASEQDQSR
jgi:hypothetical protein